MIRATNHTLKFSNTGKIDVLSLFIDESKRVANLYLDYLWNNKIEWSYIKDGETIIKVMDIQNNLLEHPNMLKNPELESKMGGLQSDLSARVKKCLLTQVLGIIGASVEKQRKRLYMLDKLKTTGGVISRQFIKKLSDNIPVKPNIDNMDLELNSICCTFEKKEDGKFNGFIKLSSLGKPYKKILIPIKFHRCNKKYSTWTLLQSFLISKSCISFRWEKEKPPIKDVGIIVGCDQGMKSILMLSDGQHPPITNNHDKSLESIMYDLSRRKKNSNGFKRAQDHRKNFINWSINQMHFDDVRQVNVEKIWNIGYKNRSSRLMSHWTNTLIRDKLYSALEILGVQVKEQSSTYRSQRCSVCGLVLKSNRKGKLYFCKDCGNAIDADLNASLNHEAILPDVPYDLRSSGLNLKGFYWKPEGFFDLNGEVLTVPPVPKIENNIVNES